MNESNTAGGPTSAEDDLLITIVVPAYNAEATLGETLDAIESQTASEWRCIVVDDGSTDDTRAVAEEYASRDMRFKVVPQENTGTAGAYNAGVRAATSAVIAVCSADDLLLPDHISVMRNAVRSHPDHSIFTCNGYLLSIDGVRAPRYTEAWANSERERTFADLFDCCFFGVGACYRRSVFERIGGYAGDAYGEDYDFWLRAMAAGYRALYIPALLSVHRQSAGQKSANMRRIFNSDIRTVEAVLATLPPDSAEAAAARAAIERRRRQLKKLWAAPFKTWLLRCCRSLLKWPR